MLRQLPHNSPEYWATIELRLEILRRPLGLDFTEDQIDAESNDFHLALFEEREGFGETGELARPSPHSTSGGPTECRPNNLTCTPNQDEEGFGETGELARPSPRSTSGGPTGCRPSDLTRMPNEGEEGFGETGELARPSPRQPPEGRQDVGPNPNVATHLVACLVLTPVDDEEIKMRQVAVATSAQNKGLGTQLVAFSEQFARDHGYIQMTLHARETAVPFYLRLGYELVGDPFTEVTIPHRAMRKPL